MLKKKKIYDSEYVNSSNKKKVRYFDLSYILFTPSPSESDVANFKQIANFELKKFSDSKNAELYAKFNSDSDEYKIEFYNDSVPSYLNKGELSSGSIFGPIFYEGGFRIVKILNSYIHDKENRYTAVVLEKWLKPSFSTKMETFNSFSKLVKTLKTNDEFERLAASRGYFYNRLICREDDFHIDNIPYSREVIKWCFTKKEGDLSDVYERGDSALIVRLNKKWHQDSKPMELVNDELNTDYINKLKVEKLVEKFSKSNKEDFLDYAKSVGEYKVFFQNRILSLSDISKFENIEDGYSLFGNIAGSRKGDFYIYEQKKGVFIIELIDSYEVDIDEKSAIDQYIYEKGYTYYSDQFYNIILNAFVVEDDKYSLL